MTTEPKNELPIWENISLSVKHDPNMPHLPAGEIVFKGEKYILQSRPAKAVQGDNMRRWFLNKFFPNWHCLDCGKGFHSAEDIWKHRG